MNLLKSKKAITETPWIWLVRIFILLPIIIFALGIVIDTANVELSKTKNIENLLIEDRIMWALSYTDPASGRIIPGIVDNKRFNEEILKQSLKTNKQIGIKLTLQDQPPIYVDQEFYEVAAPLKKTNKYKETFSKRYVLVQPGLKRSILEISIMNQIE